MERGSEKESEREELGDGEGMERLLLRYCPG